MPTPASSPLNTIVGAAYRLTRQLGEGGMGTVYEALHLRLGTKVAVKILSPQYAADPKFRDRFKREARSASQIRHPNVVQITDFGETPSGSVFFAMELLEGHDLHALLREHAPLPLSWPRAQHILAQATDALAAAHRCGVVHRDVKPANIFVLEGAGVEDFVKLLDFGIAKLLAPAPTADSVLVKNLTGTGEIFGTAKYMAPEQAYGTSDDPRVDVYSLGVVAYELLTGRVPFTGQGSFEIITRHVYEPPRPLRELRPELPAALEAVVLRALEKQPDDRFATMEEFGRALRMIAEPALAWSAAAGPPVVAATTPLPARTDAETLPRHDEARRSELEPTLFHRAIHATEPIRAAVPAGSPPRTTQPAPVEVFDLASEPPGAASPTLRTTELPRGEAPTGPVAPHGSYDETGPELAYSVSTTPSPWRLVTLSVLAAIGVGTLSAAAVIVAVAPEGDEARPTAAQVALVEPPRERIHVALPKQPEPTSSPEARVDAAEAIELTEEPTQTPDLGTTLDDEQTAVDDVRVAPKPKSKSTPKPEPKGEPAAPAPSSSVLPPQPDTDTDIGHRVRAQVKQQCGNLGIGTRIKIELVVNPSGRVVRQQNDAEDLLASCVKAAVGRPVFSGKTQNITLEVLLRKPRPAPCTDPFGDCK